MFAKWVQSYRDLPILMNQWANVMRWELRTRLFLRTTEFLWQEGHTAHATEGEAVEEALTILGIYRRFIEEWLAIPVVTGVKSDSEKFAGAVRTYALEAMMQDRKALQAGTSHHLGQNFAKQFDLTFQNEAGEQAYAWNTSWGVSTRLVGGVVMTHGDDHGVVLPPRLAPTQVVIVPIYKDDAQRTSVVGKAHELRARLNGAGVRTRVDDREQLSPGAKYYEWERKGVPVRMEIGPRDLESGKVVLVKRVRAEGEDRKEFLPEAQALAELPTRLDAFQTALLDQARARREASSHRGITKFDELAEILNGPGGFVYTGWSGDPAVEARVREETGGTLRCVPDADFRSANPPETCIGGGKAQMEVVWAKAY
jgi:prolyl-tRNA synthetase